MLDRNKIESKYIENLYLIDKEKWEYINSLGYLSGEIPAIIDRNIVKFKQREGSTSRDVFLAILLAYYIANSENRNVLFDNIDLIYSDLGYPKDISHLVSYMPSVDPSPNPEKLEKAIRNYCRDVFDRAFSESS